MNARADIEDKWEQLLAALGEADKLRLCSNDEGRSAAILQLCAIVDFLDQTTARGLAIPLIMLSRALQDLQCGAKPPMLAATTVKNRPRDDWTWQRVKIVAATIMDQLHEYAGLSRPDAAKAVEKVFSQFGLSKFRNRNISKTTIEKWRDQVREVPQTSELGREYKRFRSIDAEVLAQDAPLENKRDFLLRRRLPLLLIGIGARGPKATKAKQRFISDIDRRIPKKPNS
jgi:hypothetical protein